MGQPPPFEGSNNYLKIVNIMAEMKKGNALGSYLNGISTLDC